MRKRLDFTVKFGVVLCLLAWAAGTAFGQDEGELTAKKRLFPGVGPGLRTVKRGADGRMYVLASPALGLAVFDATGKQILSIGAQLPEAAGKTARTPIAFGEDCDADADGHIYIADRGANSVLMFSKEGALLRSISVPAPVSIAAMPEGEVGVATLHEPHLVIVFDRNGRDVREFGDPERIAERTELNRFLNIGKLATDDQGHLYYAFEYFPEPTVRQYDRYGYSGLEIQYTAIEALTTARAVRREIDRQERRGDTPTFKRVLTAVGVDRVSGEVWVALHNTLLHFDKDGNRRASYQLYTPEGARLEADTILAEKGRLIIGSDPLGIYEFERPQKKIPE
jgi:hypothetical protein